MNLSDKDYREFHDQIWERNKELIKENRKLKQELEETEHARMICEDNWKRCEQELEQNKNLYDILKHNFEGALDLNEELRRKNEKLSSELKDKKDALCDAINDFNDIQKENDKLLAHIRKLEKDKDDLNKELIKANKLDVVSGLNHEINKLKEQIARFMLTNEELEHEKHDLELANECLVDEIREVLKDNKGLHELYMEEKEKNNNLELTNDSLTKELEDLHSRIDEVCDILMDDEYPPISECIEDLRWEHDPDRKISEILTAEKTEKGITITINSDNIL